MWGGGRRRARVTTTVGGGLKSGAAGEREGALWVDRCGSGTAVASVQHLRGAGGRCDSVGVFCEAGVDARRGVDSGSLAEVGVHGRDGGCGKSAFVGERWCLPMPGFCELQGAGPLHATNS